MVTHTASSRSDELDAKDDASTQLHGKFWKRADNDALFLSTRQALGLPLSDLCLIETKESLLTMKYQSCRPRATQLTMFRPWVRCAVVWPTIGCGQGSRVDGVRSQPINAVKLGHSSRRRSWPCKRSRPISLGSQLRTPLWPPGFSAPLLACSCILKILSPRRSRQSATVRPVTQVKKGGASLFHGTNHGGANGAAIGSPCMICATSWRSLSSKFSSLIV